MTTISHREKKKGPPCNVEKLKTQLSGFKQVSAEQKHETQVVTSLGDPIPDDRIKLKRKVKKRNGAEKETTPASI